MTSKSALVQDEISLKTAALTGIGITVVVLIFIGLALFLNNQRRMKVVNTYTQETESLLREKEAQTQNFFTATFDACASELEAAKAANKTPNAYMNDVACQAARTGLSELGVDALKDSSAIAYVRVRNEQYELIEASGKYNGTRYLNDTNTYSHFRYGSERDKLMQFFLADTKLPMWDDYINYIQGKEVIVPIKVEGMRAYIFRGVMER